MHVGPQPPRSRRAASFHGVPSRLEDDRHRPHAARDLDASARDRAGRGPPLRLHRQRARRERRLDLLPVVREGADPARLGRHPRLRAHRRGRLPPLRRAHSRPLPEVRKTVRPSPHSRSPPRKSIFLKAGSKNWLAALCTSRVLAATWFVAYSAVLPLTQADWRLSAKEAGLVQSAFHLGYLTSLFIGGGLPRRGARPCVPASRPVSLPPFSLGGSTAAHWGGGRPMVVGEDPDDEE